MKKKIKNLNLCDLVFAFVCLLPIILIFMYYIFVMVSNSGVTTQNMDYWIIFITPLKDFSNVNILGLNDFNDFLLSNILKVSNDTNEILKYSITFGLFMSEYYIFVYMVKVAIKFITSILSLVDNAF